MLDHISLSASTPDLERRGFAVTPTPGAHGRHARVMLDHSYLELSVAAKMAPPRGVGWFARSDDQDALREQLEAQGMTGLATMPYTGHDGEWLDLRLPGPAPVTPVVTRRLDRVDWPPPLAGRHRNGAVGVLAVQMSARRPSALCGLLSAAGCRERDGGLWLSGVQLDIRPGSVDALTAVVFTGHRGSPLVLALSDQEH